MVGTYEWWIYLKKSTAYIDNRRLLLKNWTFSTFRWWDAKTLDVSACVQVQAVMLLPLHHQANLWNLHCLIYAKFYLSVLLQWTFCFDTDFALQMKLANFP